MRHFIIALALAASPVSADETTSPPSENGVSVSAWCAQMATMAEAMMKNRQIGVSLQDALEVADNAGEPLEAMIRMIVLDAWEQPRYNTESIQQDAIGDFRDKWHLSCIRASE